MQNQKALTITGYTLFDWALVWGERRKSAAAEQAASNKGNGFDSSGCKYSIDEIERWCVKVRQQALIDRTRFTPLSGTMSDAAGM
jgi:hypothetical protein